LKPLDLYKVDFAKNHLLNSPDVDMEYIYRGYFSDEVIDHILVLVERQLEFNGESHKIRKKAYNVMVEGLQNITRHQINSENDIDKIGIFCLKKIDNKYYITTGNQVSNTDVSKLTTMLDKLNGMNKEELRKYYVDLLNNGTFSDKGGAGIGLVDMARRSESKLYYNFKKVDEDNMFFYLKICLDSAEVDDAEVDNNLSIVKHFEDLSALHDQLLKEKITLTLRGVFTLDNVGDIIESIKKSKMGTSDSRGQLILSLMYEMLMNIIHHAAVIEKVGGVPGIFIMSENQDKSELLFTSANLIKNNQEQTLRNELITINSLEDSELDAYFLKNNIDATGMVKTGLGLINFRKRTKNNLNHYFERLDDDYTLFTLQLNLKAPSEPYS
jgi:hypothetical protein